MLSRLPRIQEMRSSQSSRWMSQSELSISQQEKLEFFPAWKLSDITRNPLFNLNIARVKINNMVRPPNILKNNMRDDILKQVIDAAILFKPFEKKYALILDELKTDASDYSDAKNLLLHTSVKFDLPMLPSL